MPELPKVQVSALLADWAERHNEDLPSLVVEFAHWKVMKDERNSFYFGKDGFYARPLRHGQRVLRHVHMPPDEQSDRFPVWEEAYEEKWARTSDTILIYADGGRHGYLLLHIVKEPDGHDFAEMRTSQDRSMMKQFADAADAFIHNGEVMHIANIE
jgi:mRNA interferase YafO